MTNNSKKSTTQPPIASIRDGIGLALLELARTDQRVVVLSADLTASTRVLWFKQQFPDRFFDVGVAEQNLAGLAAGMALRGKIPFIASYSVFSPGINWGAIRSSICYSNLPVKIIGGHAGLATGPDGATHQALEDIALMRVLPNMTVVAPANGEEAFAATLAVATTKGPAYIRSIKPESTPIKFAATFQLGKGRVVQPGEDVTIFAHGSMVQVAIEAAMHLRSHHITSQVVNMHTIKPLDQSVIKKALATTRAIISIEDHQVSGGLGSAIAEYKITTDYNTPLTILGVNDQFGESGQMDQLYEKHGLTAQKITQAMLKMLKK